MKLEFRCSSCKKPNNFKPVFPTRGLLQMELDSDLQDDEIKVNCDYCGNVEKKHINRIEARGDKNKILIAIIISVIVSFALLMYLGLIGTITLTIPFLVWLQENKATKDFNSYKIRRK